MDFIVVNRDSLGFTLSDDAQEGAFAIPIKLRPPPRPASPIEYQIMLSDSKAARGKKVTLEDLDLSELHFTIDAPEPWLITISMLMWHRIVQGMAWETVKVLVNRALWKLKLLGLAPTANPLESLAIWAFNKTGLAGKYGVSRSTSQEIAKKSKTEVGVFYDEYAKDGEMRREMFLGLRRTHESMSKKEREEVLGVQPKPYRS